MLNYRFLAVSLLLGASFVSLPSLHAQERVMADQVVAVVGNSAVLYSDVVMTSNQLREQRRQQGVTSDRDPECESLEKLVIQKLLYNQSIVDSIRVSMGNLEMMVQDAVDREIEERGSLAALEQFYRKPVFNIREDMRARYEEMYHANSMEQDVRSKVKVIPGEVERFYRHLPKDSLPMIPEQYVYSQILRYPPSIEEAKLRTRERLLEMRERISKGTRFDLLARMYSEDPGTALRGGEMDFMTKESFVQPFADALSRLKVDQVSEVVETEFGFHLIQLVEQKGNLYRCRHILLKPQFSANELKVSFTTLDSLKGEILGGKTTFEEAVKNFSQDKYSKENAGLVSNLEVMEMSNNSNAKAASTRFLKEELAEVPGVYNALRGMKVGDISDAFASQDMKGNQMTKIIRLDQIVPAHPASLSEDYLRVEEIALVDKQNKEYEKWLKGKVDGMYIRIADEFKSCAFERQYIIK